MAELKHTFTSGRMNKDLDERLIPNGEYIDALNVQVASSEGSDVGALENVLGNEKLSKLKLKNAFTLGSIAYNIKNKIYWIVTSDDTDGIYEYDQLNNVVSPILIDTKTTNTLTLDGFIIDSNSESELIIDNFNASTLNKLIGNTIPKEIGEEILIKNNITITASDPFIRISIPKNTVLIKDENEKIVFKNIIYDGKKYGNIDAQCVYISNGILNFSRNNLITGINIIDDLLFWTDNLNQPRRINIPEFKKYTNGVYSKDTEVQYYIKDTNSNKKIKQLRAFTEDDISVVKKAPMYAPNMELFDSISDGVIAIKYSLDLNNLFIGQVLKVENPSQLPIWKEGDFVLITSANDDFEITASVKSTSDSLIELSVVTITGDTDKTYNCDIELKQKKPLYELNFVRFSYRWKYNNGEYSVISPFTPAAFIPDEFKFDGKEAFNYGMINRLQRVLLNNFDLGGDDIKEIDILFKEGRNQNIYIYKTIKKIDFTGEVEIQKEKIHSLLPNDQLLRAWDNVPKKAKAQEVTANRVIYGNYTQNYDVYSAPDFSISYKDREGILNRTIKSGRTYQIGVSYIDEYNRHTPILAPENESGTKKIPITNSTSKSKFVLKANNKPPAWAKWFKYYIKDTSGEYYNLAADKFYQDKENGFTYVSFPSSDRNKVTEENYLYLKKKHGSNEPVEVNKDTDARYKIIDIFSEPPEFITNRKRQVYSIGDIVFTDDYSASGGGNAITNRNQTDAGNGSPVEEYASIQIKKSGTGDGGSGGSGVPIDDANEIKPGRFIQFAYGDKTSKTYEVKSIQQHPSGSNEIKITVTEPFEDDVNIVYEKIPPFNLGDQTTNLGVSINVLETYSAAGDKEFDGRFFVKLKTNSTLTSSIVSEAIGDKSYLVKDGIPINGTFLNIYEDKKLGGFSFGLVGAAVSALTKNVSSSFNSRGRFRKNAIGDPIVPFIVSEGGTASGGKVFGVNTTNVTFEQTTHKSDEQFDNLVRKIKVGDLVRFKTVDGELHHDAIYEIGAKYTSTRKQNDWSGKTGLDKKRTIKQISLYFIDPETAEPKPLEQSIVTKNENKEMFMEILNEIDEENIIIKEPAVFETEPLKSKTELDIYYETEKAIPIEEHGQEHELDWYNAISFSNGVESNRIRDDFNAIFIDTGVRASTVLAEPLQEEYKFNSLIWSGIINSRSGTNQSNQFNMANSITKDLLPSYGSVQKLFARDSDLVIYCEDKILQAFADKDILYNADGSSNLVASNKVIGNVKTFTGEYGISQNPESFAFYGFRAYNVDKKRGVILRLSRDGLTPISANNMSSYFRGSLYNASGNLLGSYDARNKLYNISLNDLTVCFSEDVNGWTTFKSYMPQNGISLNNAYYTYKNGELWLHDSNNVPYNNFYGNQGISSIELNINDNPSIIKKYRTLGYEGTSGWKATVETDQQTSSELAFKEKENKYFVNINGEAKTLDNIDLKNISAQGIGKSVRKTTIPVSGLDVVVGKNGEIIIIGGGGGSGSSGSDIIITGDDIVILKDDNGNISVSGGNINVNTGDGNTDGSTGLGDNISSGGGGVNSGSGGGIGIDDQDNDNNDNSFSGDIILNDTGGSDADNFGDINDDGTSDDIGDIDQEDPYQDQLGDISNTTLTIQLDTPVLTNAKPVEITKKPGEASKNIKFTITPADGYLIDVNDFSSTSDFTFAQSGINITATLNETILQPSLDETINITINGTAEKKPIVVSGNITYDITNANLQNQVSFTSYNVEGEYGEEKIIADRVVTADAGFVINANDIKVDNSSINIEKIKLSKNSFRIIESVFIPRNTIKNNNYKITLDAPVEIIPNKILLSRSINTTSLNNNGEDRDFVIKGEQGAEFKIIFSDTSSTILEDTYKIDSTGLKTINLNFDAGDAAETYTIKLFTVGKTDFDSNFGTQTITISRPVKERKTASFLVNYSKTINKSFIIEDYIGSTTSRDFDFTLTLASGTYTIGKQPSSANIQFGDNNNDTVISLDNIEFDTTNTNELTVSGTMTVNNFQENEVYTLDISPFVGIDVTTTFDYDNNSKDGTGSGNYTASSTTYTVDGGAGLLSTPTVSEYFWTLTPSASNSFKTDIDADDFEFLNSSNADVVDDFALNNEILLRKVGDNIEIGFKTKSFTQPSSSQTFTIRPKNSTTLTEATPTTTIPAFFYEYKLFAGVDEVYPTYPDLQSGGYLKDLNINNDKLVQLNYTANNSKGIFDPSETSDSDKFYLTNTDNTHITLATAGTYDSVTITGPFEISSDKKTLTVNLLINLGGSSSITSGKVSIHANTTTQKALDANNSVIDKFNLVAIKLAGCKHQDGGPNENNLEWSPLNADSDIWPKWYATKTVLDSDTRLYNRPSPNVPVPGFEITTPVIIQKGNEGLFSVGTRKNASGLIEYGWVKDIGTCSLDGSHLDINTNIQKPKLYNDIVKYSYPVKSNIYENEKVTLTGSFTFDNKAGYDAIVTELNSKGITTGPIKNIDLNTSALTFEYDAYFDKDGNSSVDIDLLRGSEDYGINLKFDNLNTGSSLKGFNLDSHKMLRRATEDQDNNDHVSNLNDYDEIKEYNQVVELNRGGSGDSNFDSTSSRVTNNTANITNENGITIDGFKVKTLPDDVQSQQQVLEYLMGANAAKIFSDTFRWRVKSIYSKSYEFSGGPLSGYTKYVQTSMQFRLTQPQSSTTAQGTEALLTYLDVWQKITDGTITSFKIPMDLLKLEITLGRNNTDAISGVRQPTERIATTTLDFNGGFAVLPSIRDNGNAYNSGSWNSNFKNYYIANNIYVSETVGTGGVNSGIYAAPNYEYIQFWVGVTIPYYTIDKKTAHSINAKVPFSMDSIKGTANTNVLRQFRQGQRWSFKGANDDLRKFPYKNSDTVHPNANPGFVGIFNMPGEAGFNNIKFYGIGKTQGSSIVMFN
jgi:hypothetical protein